MGTGVGLSQLAVGVDMVIQVAPVNYSSLVILEIDLVLNKLKYFVISRLTHQALKTFPQPGSVQLNCPPLSLCVWM